MRRQPTTSGGTEFTYFTPSSRSYYCRLSSVASPSALPHIPESFRPSQVIKAKATGKRGLDLWKAGAGKALGANRVMRLFKKPTAGKPGNAPKLPELRGGLFGFPSDCGFQLVLTQYRPELGAEQPTRLWIRANSAW